MAYATIADVRAEGITTTIASDSLVTSSLLLWQQFVERATRQFFESKALTIDLDGNDTSTLFLPVPVITVTQLFVNDDFVSITDATAYRIYNGRQTPQDDRWNPRIKMIKQNGLYNSPRTRLGPVFLRGVKNQRIVGTWGFTESDGTTPTLIKRALLKLVVRDLKQQAGGGLNRFLDNPRPAGDVLSETTDGHNIMYAASRIKAINAGLTAITGDPEVDKIIELYRAPTAMAVPGSDLLFMG